MLGQHSQLCIQWKKEESWAQGRGEKLRLNAAEKSVAGKGQMVGGQGHPCQGPGGSWAISYHNFTVLFCLDLFKHRDTYHCVTAACSARCSHMPLRLVAQACSGLPTRCVQVPCVVFPQRRVTYPHTPHR